MERIVLKMPTIKELKELREKLKITQKEAAAAVGIKQPYLARIENEDANPSYSLVCKLISFYEAVENKPKEKISQYYNPIIVYANANDKVIAAVRKMRKNDYSQLPVFSNGKSVGSISEGIVCREEIKKGKENVLDMKVAEIMGPVYPELDIDAPVEIARQLLTSVDLILVRKKEKIIGVITKSDLI